MHARRGLVPAEHARTSIAVSGSFAKARQAFDCTQPGAGEGALWHPDPRLQEGTARPPNSPPSQEGRHGQCPSCRVAHRAACGWRLPCGASTRVARYTGWRNHACAASKTRLHGSPPLISSPGAWICYSIQGLTIATPTPSKSATLRVTTLPPRTRAIAASMRSMVPLGRPIFRRAANTSA